MPIVHIDLWEGRTKEQKRMCIENVSEAVASSLDIPAEHVHVVLNNVKKEDWGLHGKQAE